MLRGIVHIKVGEHLRKVGGWGGGLSYWQVFELMLQWLLVLGFDTFPLAYIATKQAEPL